MNLFLGTFLIAATISAGLIAGLYYGFACAVMPGLRQVDDQTFVATFRSINRAIINGWFLVAFIGSPLLIVAFFISAVIVGGPQPWIPMTTAAALTILSSAITGGINVPLNNAVEKSAVQDAGIVRSRFENRWRRANMARTAASTAAFGALVWAVAIS